MSQFDEFALVGFPNSGKTTLFNALTGMKQRVGNWPGVTVEKKSGQCRLPDAKQVDVVDLPGIQSLLVTDHEYALDAAITRQYIMHQRPKFLLNVIDALSLERDLYLTHELLELGLPIVVCVSKTQLANKRGIELDTARLESELGVPVLDADRLTTEQLLEVIQQFITQPPQFEADTLFESLPQIVATRLTDVDVSKGIALHCLEGDVFLPKEVKFDLAACQSALADDIDFHIADWRFGRLHDIASRVIKQKPVILNSNLSKLDDIVMHRFFGIPLFLTVMYTLFTVSIGLGTLFQSSFDYFSETVFINWPLYWLGQLHSPPFILALVAGVGKGINTTFTFMPVLFFMFFCLAFLEQSGYMVRAAVIIDRLMRQIGLSGKAFIPLIIGLGCNVPAVMATRTLENPRDRIVTALMSPFMSCGARLAIYAVFVSLFFADNPYGIVFSLYLIGVVVAIITGWLVRNGLLKGREKPLVMELPRYQMPRLGFLVTHGLNRVTLFVKRTARVIIPLCMLLTLLSRFDLHGNWLEADLSQSWLAYLGQQLTFLFRPMGISAENWPAVIGLLSGMVAKEVVVGTLNTLYYMPELIQLTAPSLPALVSGCWDAFAEQLTSFVSWLSHPWSSMLSTGEFKPEAGEALVQHFQTRAAAYAYLLFVLLYVPCFSTIAAIEREINRFWAWFSVAWSTFIAYILAVLAYQILTLHEHMQEGLLIIAQVLIMTALIAYLFKYYLTKYSQVVV